MGETVDKVLDYLGEKPQACRQGACLSRSGQKARPPQRRRVGGAGKGRAGAR